MTTAVAGKLDSISSTYGWIGACYSVRVEATTVKLSIPLLTGVAVLTVACSVDAPGESTPEDTHAPLLVVDSPARAAHVDESYVTVTGHVTDAESGPESVTVNGHIVALAEDGSFQQFLELQPGVTLIHTTAVDRAGNEVAETRAVLSGQMKPGTEPVQDGVVSHFTEATLEAITGRASAAADAYFASMAESEEPMFDVGADCLGATGYLEGVSIDDLQIDGRYIDGGIEFEIHAAGVRATFDTDYAVLCLDGNTDVIVDADAIDATAPVLIGLDGPGDLSVELADFETTFEGLHIDIGFMDDDLIPEIERAIADLLSEKTAEMVVPTVNSLFEGLDTSTVVEVLGRELRIEVRPTVAEFTPQGGLFKADTQIQLIGQESLPYLSTPRPAPERSVNALGAALADDVFDQVFGPMWGAGLLEWQFEAEGQFAALGSVGADGVRVELRLPPTLSSPEEGGTPEITVGGLELEFLRGETSLARVSVSARIDVDIRVADDQLQILTGARELWLTKLDGGEEFSEREMNILAAFLETALPEDMRAMLDGVPIPPQYGPLLNAPSISVQRGYVFFGDDPLP